MQGIFNLNDNKTSIDKLEHLALSTNFTHKPYLEFTNKAVAWTSERELSLLRVINFFFFG